MVRQGECAFPSTWFSRRFYEHSHAVRAHYDHAQRAGSQKQLDRLHVRRTDLASHPSGYRVRSFQLHVSHDDVDVVAV